MKLPKDFDLGKYGKSLYDRRSEAIELGWADCGDEKWMPREKDCHANVTELCSKNTSLTPVRGWLFYDGNVRAKFVAHSAVKSDDGFIYDITPPNTIQRPPFIIAHESEEVFECLVVNVGDFFYMIQR